MKLGELCDVVRGSSPRPKGDARFYGGNVPRLMVADLTRDGKFVTPKIDSLTELGARQSRPMKKGDVVIAVSGNPGLSAILNADACIHDGFVGLRNLNLSKISTDYLYRFLVNAKDQTNSGAVGAIFKNLTTDQIKRIEIPLPPLEEQKRIAEVLDKADALRQKRRLALQKLDTLLQSVFLETFGDPIKNPRGWAVARFDEVCKTRLGKMLDQKKFTGKNLRPYLRNANVQWNRFDLTDLDEMDFDERERGILRLNYGDLLICEGGEVGRTAIWRNELSECYYQKALHKGTPDPKRTTPEFLMFLMWFFAKNGGFKDYVTSVTIAHLTGEKLKTIKIPLPPIELQRKFSEIVNRHSLLKQKTRGLAKITESLFQSIQCRAFEGDLFHGSMPSVGFEPENAWQQTSRF